MPVLTLLAVRHGQSVGNVAWQRAYAAGSEVIDLPSRDPDIVLSELGERQAAAVGGALADLQAGDRPTSVWTSPFVRARETARIALESAGWSVPVRVDERLRDRELGVLSGLTWTGVQNRHPDEAARMRHLGKFYYRPPGGESWADIVLRLRSWVGELDTVEPTPRVLVTAHDVVVLLLRYVLLGLDEAELFEVVRSGSVRNASITGFARPSAGQPWALAGYNDVGHLASLETTGQGLPDSSVGAGAAGTPPA